MWNQSKSVDWGLLLLRLGFGLSMAVFHGWGKITGGPDLWVRIGGSMSMFGLGFWPVFWGFMAAFSEFVGSILLILGLGFRIAAFLLAATMLVAAIKHLNLPPESAKAGWKGASHALEFLTVYVALFLSGPGKFALDSKFNFRGRKSA